MQRNFKRENRETPSLSQSYMVGRKENAMSGKSFMNGDGESYCGIVCAEQRNVQEG